MSEPTQHAPLLAALCAHLQARCWAAHRAACCALVRLTATRTQGALQPPPPAAAPPAGVVQACGRALLLLLREGSVRVDAAELRPVIAGGLTCQARCACETRQPAPCSPATQPLRIPSVA